VTSLARLGGEVRHEVTARAQIEQHDAPRLGQGKGLARPGQIGQRRRLGGGRGRRHDRSGRRRRGGDRGSGRRGHRRRATGLQLLDAAAERPRALLVGLRQRGELTTQRLQLEVEGLGLLGVRHTGRCDRQQDEPDRKQSELALGNLR
jgi:hypothetical protein